MRKILSPDEDMDFVPLDRSPVAQQSRSETRTVLPTLVHRLDEQIEQLLIDNAQNTLAIGALLEAKIKEVNKAVETLQTSNGTLHTRLQTAQTQSDTRTDRLIQKVEDTYQKSGAAFHAAGQIAGTLKDAEKSLDNVLSADRRKVEGIVREAGDKIQSAAQANLDAAAQLSTLVQQLRTAQTSMEAALNKRFDEAEQKASHRQTLLQATVTQESASLTRHMTGQTLQAVREIKQELGVVSKQLTFIHQSDTAQVRRDIETAQKSLEKKVSELKTQSNESKTEVVQLVRNVADATNSSLTTAKSELDKKVKYLFWITGLSLFFIIACLSAIVYLITTSVPK